MAADVEIRPLRDGDVEGADALAARVLVTPDPGENEAARRARGEARIVHLAGTDPGGAWVAARDGDVVGVALALVREGVWGLSLFAVAEAVQGRGVGSALLRRTLAHGAGARGRLILSSTHPAAMRAYARTGLALRPCVAAAGIADHARIPDLHGVEEAGPDGIAVADAIGREIRGAGHGRDLPVALASGARLLLVEDRAFCLARGGRRRAPRAAVTRPPPAPRCGPRSRAPDRARRSASTSSPRARTGRSRSRWPRAWSSRPTARCSPAERSVR